MEGGVLSVAGATAVETLEADIEAVGVVLEGMGSGSDHMRVEWSSKEDMPHNGVKALGAVLAIDRLGGRRGRDACSRESVKREQGDPLPFPRTLPH